MAKTRGQLLMEPNADKPKAPVSKNPNANEDLKSLSSGRG